MHFFQLLIERKMFFFLLGVRAARRACVFLPFGEIEMGSICFLAFQSETEKFRGGLPHKLTKTGKSIFYLRKWV
jgi:hypothetical protein